MSILAYVEPSYYRSLLDRLRNIDTALSSRASESTLQDLRRDVVAVRYGSYTIPSGYALVVHAATEVRFYGVLDAYGEVVAVGDLVVH